MSMFSPRALVLGGLLASAASAGGETACGPTAFCDDFESGAPGGAPLGPWRVEGSLQVSEAHAHGGARSVLVEARGGGYNRNFLTLDLSAYPGVQRLLYGRMYLWVEAPERGDGGDFTFAAVDGPADPRSGAPQGTAVMVRYRVAARGPGSESTGTLMSNYDTWVDADHDGRTDWATDCWKRSDVPLPTGRWVCVEWSFDTHGDRFQYGMDGVEQAAIGVQGAHADCADPARQSGRWISPTRFEALHVGLEQYHAEAPPRRVWIDDVAVGPTRIGCP